MAEIVMPFLNGVSGRKSWAEQVNEQQQQQKQ